MTLNIALQKCRLQVCALIALALLMQHATLLYAHDFEHGDLDIGHPFIGETPPNAEQVAGYLSITNNGKEPAWLVGAKADFADDISFHLSSVVDGTADMKTTDGGIEIPANNTVVFEPTAMRIVFSGLKKHPKKGDKMLVQLLFDQGVSVDVEFWVESVATTHVH